MQIPITNQKRSFAAYLQMVLVLFTLALISCKDDEDVSPELAMASIEAWK